MTDGLGSQFIESPIGEARQGFRLVALKDFVFFQEGPGLRKWQWTDDGMKVINVTNILGDGTFDPSNTSRYIALDEFQKKYSHFAVEPGDIVVASSGNTYGKVSRVSAQHLPLMMNTSVIRFRPLDGVELDANFLYAFIRSPYFRRQVEQFVIGSAQPNFGPTHVGLMKLLLPPLPTQQRIAAILSAYDDLIETNTRRIAILEEMARRLYEEWFVKDRPSVDETSADWEWTTLGAICEAGGGSIQTGPFGSQLHQRDYQSTGTPVVMPKNIRGGRIVADECARVSEEDAKRLSKHELNAFDIVFGRRGEIGRKALVRPHEAGALCGTGCLKVSLGIPEVSPFYISEFLSEEQTVADLSGRAIGATMPNLNTSILAETKIAMPPTRAAEQYHELASASDEMTTVLHRKNANLRAQRDLLLPKLVSGEIDVSEAENAMEAAE